MHARLEGVGHFAPPGACRPIATDGSRDWLAAASTRERPLRALQAASIRTRRIADRAGHGGCAGGATTLKTNPLENPMTTDEDAKESGAAVLAKILLTFLAAPVGLALLLKWVVGY